jgi:hypothetical protein
MEEEEERRKKQEEGNHLKTSIYNNRCHQKTSILSTRKDTISSDNKEQKQHQICPTYSKKETIEHEA